MVVARTVPLCGVSLKKHVHYVHMIVQRFIILLRVLSITAAILGMNTPPLALSLYHVCCIY